jgi:2-polyprenyl-3-methyl-5-hydroxy-6-metoxy-1,4-benzoquinol methylase
MSSPSDILLGLPDKETGEEYGLETLRERFPDMAGAAILRLPPGSFPPAGKDWIPGSEDPPSVLLDLRNTPRSVFRQWLALTPVLIGLDDGGPCRQLFPWLVDTLGTGGRGGAPNLRILPVERSTPPDRSPGRRILVSFGGEDPAALTAPTVNRLLAWGIPPTDITVIKGPLFREPLTLPGKVTCLEGVSDLTGSFPGHSTLLTSYGLTAYEGIMSGLKVLLVNPTRVHRFLGRQNGFITDPGVGQLSNSAKKWLASGSCPAVRERILSRFEPESGPGTVAEGIEPAGSRCPCCGNHVRRGKPLLRKPDGSFFRCPGTGLVHFSVFRSKALSDYSENYFFDQYRQQYGKTYLEDFDNIRDLGRRRMVHISAVSRKAGGDLLDIGCAYGPFLAAAAEAGYSPCGTDIAAEAVKHVSDVLGYPAVKAGFPSERPVPPDGRTRWDVVTLWFVIEHFPDLRPVFQTLDSLVRPGGILAFSTPNGRGLSAMRSRRRFLENSPEDHFSVMDRRSVRKILKKYSFRIRKIVMTGHHPERFFPGLSLDRRPLLRGFLMALSRLFRLGDTFEVYAVKKGGEWV